MAGSPAIEENPFYVLGLPADTSRIEIEREAQKLLGMLELGFDAAKMYETPLGPRVRTPELVRAAVAALRDPYRRLIAELWARHAPETTDAATTPSTPDPVEHHTGLRRRLGWGP